jgi:hypothetical protein
MDGEAAEGSGAEDAVEVEADVHGASLQFTVHSS